MKTEDIEVDKWSRSRRRRLEVLFSVALSKYILKVLQILQKCYLWINRKVEKQFISSWDELRALEFKRQSTVQGAGQTSLHLVLITTVWGHYFLCTFLEGRTVHRTDNELAYVLRFSKYRDGQNTAVWGQGPTSTPLHHGAFHVRYFIGKKKTPKGNHGIFEINDNENNKTWSFTYKFEQN